MFLVGDASEDLAHADRLAGFVETAFPSLRLGERRLEQSGGDHVLLIVDERFAFRFPRSGMHGLNLERAVLERLRHRSPVPTPAYKYVDPEGRFAGYPLINGSALTPARFAALARTRQQDVLRTAATFLTELHALAADMIAPASAWPSLASSLRENDLSSLLGQVKSLARRQPALFVGASLAAGFAVARLGKIVAADVSRDDLPNMPEVGHGR